jgi:gluconate 2-dehydrogenase gamma chain
MANQGADRRTILEMLAKAAVASQFTGFDRWAFAQQHHATETAPQRAKQYQPTYFLPPEYRAIEILTDLIIPEDETPGAKQAGVSEFIDFMAAHGEHDIQQPMRDGLAGLDVVSKQSNHETFNNLSTKQQVDILERLAAMPVGDPGNKFFRLIRRYTVMGYYTSRVGLKELDYPGLRFYSESPACPHTNDPEHLHLPSPLV